LEQGYPAHLAAAGTLGRGKRPLLPGLDDVCFATRFAAGKTTLPIHGCGRGKGTGTFEKVA
jgi:hypothetical protein